MSTSPFANLNRRQILQLAALMGGAATLAACGGTRRRRGWGSRK
ncbi:hypothetical protein [Arthrobacter psychrolactophilus]